MGNSRIWGFPVIRLSSSRLGLVDIAGRNEIYEQFSSLRVRSKSQETLSYCFCEAHARSKR